MNIIKDPSPNFGPRRDGKTVRFLMLHYTATLTGQEAIDLMKHPPHEASSHYMIDLDGTITQLVDEEQRAWHAGLGYWEGEKDINSTSIGIEIQNIGKRGDLVPYPDAQIEAVKELSLDIIKRWNIKPQHVLGHSDTSVGRKEDPGHLFPWEYLAREGIGLWPSHNAEGDASSLIADLHAYGYDPTVPHNQLIAAFQRRFEPQVFSSTGDADGVPTAETAGKIKSLLAQRV